MLFSGKKNRKEYRLTSDNWSKETDIGSNKIVGKLPRKFEGASIVFRGENNILVFQKGFKRFTNCSIVFNGNNAVVFICNNDHNFVIDAELESSCVLYVGADLFSNKQAPLTVRLHKRDSLYIGDDCLFSLAIKMDSAYLSRKGHGDIVIGNHVWLGQNVDVYGGSVIRGGAVIGARSVVSGEEIPSNTLWATRDGHLKQLKTDIVFARQSIRNTPRSEDSENDTVDPDFMEWMLSEAAMDLAVRPRDVKKIRSAADRVEYLKKQRKLNSFNKMEQEPPESDGSEADADLPESLLPQNSITGSYVKEGRVSIHFTGHGNRLIVEDGTILGNCVINFNGDNGLIYLRRSSSAYNMKVSMHNDTTLFIDEGCSFAADDPVRLSAAESRSIVVGRGCSFGSGIWIRTSDQHAIFDIATRKRINRARSVMIGDGVDIADDTAIFKRREVIRDGMDEERLKSMRELIRRLDETTDMEERTGLISNACSGQA